MRKAERLFKILNLLRSRRTVVTARQLAEYCSVSDRTIYRDIQALSLSGVPIESEAGVGYRLMPGYSIPPIMFTAQELEALLLGARMVQRWGDSQLGAAGDSALSKIRAILPDKLHFDHAIKPEWLIVPDYMPNEAAQFGEQIRSAIKARHILQIEYTSEQQIGSKRRIWPLAMLFWGKVWTLVSWCELRSEYRSFRLDRITHLESSHTVYPLSEQINLQHFFEMQSKHY